MLTFIEKLFKRKSNLTVLEEKVVERTFLLEKSKSKINKIIEDMQEGYFECDISGRLIKVNQKFIHMLEFSDKDEIFGISLSSLIDDVDEIKQYISNLRINQLNHKYLVLKLKTIKSKKLIVLEIYLDSILDDASNVIGFRGFVRDETEKYNLIKQLESNNEILKDYSDSLVHNQSQFLFDLALARSLQDKFLPIIPYLEDWDIGVHFQPVTGISGDFYDFYMGREKELKGLCLFDVSGHGISSGLLSLLGKHIINNEFRKQISENYTFCDILKVLDKKLTKELRGSGFYLSGLILNIDENNNIEYANAGHPPIIKVSNKKAYRESIKNNGFMIGNDLYALYDLKLTPNKIEMNKGDYLILYSDCLVEESNYNKEYFEDKIIEILECVPNDYSAEEITQHIVSELYKFTGTNYLKDDLTIITIKKK